MASTVERTTAALEGHLQLGETLLAATQAQLDGGTMRIAKRTGAGGGLGGIAGAVVAGQLASGGSELESTFANGVVVAVTDRRVVLLDVSAVSAKPKGPVLDIDRSNITAVETGEKRVMLVKMPTIALTIAGDEPSELHFEVSKIARRDAEAVVTALRS